MGDGRKLPVIITLTSVVLLLLLAGYYTYNEFLRTNNSNTCQITNYKEFSENAKTQRLDEELKSIKNYRINITKSGNVYVNSELIETNVLKSFEVQAYKSNVCDGNNRLIFVKEDGTISALNLDMLDCTNEIKLITDFGKLKNVIKVYYRETESATVNEPAGYSVYAMDIDGMVTNITKYLEK